MSAAGDAAHMAPTEDRIHAILDAVPDVIFGLDAQGRVEVVNASVASVFGIEPQDALGREIRNCCRA